MFRVSDDDPDVLQLIPAEVFEQRYARGESISRLEKIAKVEHDSAHDESVGS